ncbi:MAG: protein translocase subunit SecF [Hyphomonadaceae bacterium]
MRLFPRKTRFKFVRFAYFASFGSILAVLISFGSMFSGGLRENPIALYQSAAGSPLDRMGAVLSHGFNLGIDFKGGTLIEFHAPMPIDLGAVRAAVARAEMGEVQVQGFGDPNHAMVRFENREGADTNAASEAVQAQVRRVVDSVVFDTISVVGPKVSSELFTSGLIALGLAMLLVMVYIWFRFDLQFGFGAVLSLFHDAILTLGLFSLARIEFTLPVIAGILTIIGYSMNDTVVVFDRMRENFRKYKSMAASDVIDLSINETLSRTLMTLATTLIASVALYIFGGESLRPFAICMVFGVIVATYSSIYIAAPATPLIGDKSGRPQPKHGMMARTTTD